jgi:hypothetical protein
VPERFSWVDQRLVREGWLPRCPTESWALYLFLITVSDRRGMSYYSDRAICHHLTWDPIQLDRARDRLLKQGLIGYRTPWYQVLELATGRSEVVASTPQATSPTSQTTPSAPQAARYHLDALKARLRGGA